MLWKNWLNRWYRQQRKPIKHARRAVLSFEALEDRFAPAVGFGKATLTGVSLANPTSLQFGPDGRLYVAEQGGLIKAITVVRNGANSYTASAAETISLVRNIVNHNDDGNLNTNVVGRQVTGVLVTGTAANPILYVTSSDPRIGGGDSGTNTNLDTNSGILSRLTWTGSSWTKLDLVRGLPRSEENHSSNGMALDSVNNVLYIAQGGHTNMGAASNNFTLLPEYALSAAILSINLTAIGNTTYDLPTLDDESRAGTTDVNDPFGGNNGKNQAILVPGGPVQVYSSGFRNPYDVVITQSGRIYSIDNGGNAGWGDVPLDASGNPTTAATAANATNAVHEPGISTPDNLHLVTQGLYAGHPNPTRANMANKFNTTNPQSPVSVANPVEGYFRTIGTEDGSLTTFGASTNGLTEYTAGNFSGEMTGDLLTASFDNTIYRIKLNSTGTGVVSKTALFSNVGVTPLDVTVGAGSLGGTIWVADHQFNGVIVFEPNDFSGGSGGGTGADDANLDDDGDHYNNHDEIVAGTNPLSSADAPHDWDTDYTSDQLDSNDDNDNLADVVDPFVIDAANGKSTSLPLNYPWNNETPYPGGLLNLGFTGLMSNGVTNYAQLYDTTKLTAGGAAGALTIDAVTAGTAKGSANNQEYGFQFGINATAATSPFVVHARVLAPFAGLTPQAGQQVGIQFGTGNQDNYVALVIDGDGSVKLMKEVSGVWSLIGSTTLTLSGLAHVDLYITVDPAGSAKAGFTSTAGGVTGAMKAVGTSTTIPTTWFSAATAPAVGLLTTTGGKPSFPATYDLIEVQYTWTTGANLPVALGEVAGGIINGKLYLVGEGSSATLAYDLTTNTWTSNLAVRPFVGNHHTAEVINGKLYLFGGLGGSSEGKVQIYNPATNTWSQGATMPFAAGSSSSAVIGGQVYVAGGIIGSTTTAQAAKYNPSTNTWTTIAAMPQGRNHAASATDGSKLYIFGGRGAGSGDGNVVANGFNTVQIYNPATNTWTSSLDTSSTVPPLPQARGGMGKAVFQNGEFYVLGGETSTGAGATSNNVYDRVDIYNSSTQTWRLGVPMPVAKHGIYPLLGVNGQGQTRIYVAGGGTQAGFSASASLESYLLTPAASPAATLPTAPTGLTGQGSLPSRVTLTWADNSSNETGFVIERKTGTGAYAVLANVGAGVLSYTDVNVVAGTQYAYRVAAKNSAGNSAYSNEATITAPVSTGQTPFGGSVWAAPGLIQAEDFDNGGEGIAYHDTWSGNEGGAYRDTGVDLEATGDTGGGYNVAYIKAGEWLEYTINVAATGTQTLELRVASPGAGGTFHVEFNGVNKTGTLTIPNTGGFQVWQTISVPVQLTAGQQVLRVAFDAENATTGYFGNFNWLKLSSTTSSLPTAPSNLAATALSSTQVNLSWTDNSTNETGFVIERKTGTGTYAVLTTVGAGVTSYSDTTTSASTQYTYRVAATGSSGNSAYSLEATVTTPAAAGQTPFTGTPWAIPGLIQAEDFDNGGEGVAYHDTWSGNEGGAYRTTGVDLEGTTDTGGGYNVAYVKAGEWVEYTINVAAAGSYTLEVRLASSGVGGDYHVEVDGVNKTGTLTVPNTGGFQAWQTVSVPVQLAAGQQVLRLAFDTQSATTGYTANFNWIKLSAVTSSGPAAPSNLVAVDSPTKVTLSWTDNSTNETGFVIERKTGVGAYSVLATVGAGVTTYSDTTALASTAYTYRVLATSTAGNSPYSNEYGLTTAAAEITITDVSRSEGNGGGNTSFIFTVTLSRASSQTITVQYATANGTANLNDYTAAAGTLTFTAGQTSKTITVQVKRERLKEATETFYVDLSNAVNAVIKKTRGVGTIVNDD